MPITLSCPVCKGGVTAQDEQVGQTVECPSCLAVVAVPSIPPVAVPASVAAPPLPPVRNVMVGSPYVAMAEDPTSLWRHFTHCLANYATFSGRARRREFWGFCLFWFVVSMSLGVVNLAIPPKVGLVLSWLFMLGFLLPSFAVICRRFHDIGKSGNAAAPLYIFIPAYMISGAISGWMLQPLMREAGMSSPFRVTPQDMTQWSFDGTFAVATGLSVLSGLLSLAVAIYILIYLTRDSVPGDNAYGPNPKETLPRPYGTEVKEI